MSERLYPVLVAVWVLAAVVAVASTLVGDAATVEAEHEAFPRLPPGARSAASFETEDTLPSALAGVVVEAVQGEWSGPGGRPFWVAVRSMSEVDYRYRPIGRETWYLGLRLEPPALRTEPCVSCHGAQGLVDGRRDAEAEEIHQNIQPVHPSATGADCLTCHAAEDPSRLRLGTGDTAPIDHAYRLCAQCHFQQVESWAYGAHGKRLVGWRGRRVVMGCSECHDPHRPATEVRAPYAGFQLPGRLGVEPEEDAEHGTEATGAPGHGGDDD